MSKLKDLTAKEKFSLVKSKIEDCTHLLDELILLNENNAQISSALLRDQIPRSLAAHSYNNLSRSLYHYELIRICTLWDSYGLSRKSIPTIIKILESKDVLKLIFEDFELHHNTLVANTGYLNPHPDPYIQMSIHEDHVEREKIEAKRKACHHIRAIKRISKKAKEIEKSENFKKLKNSRNKFLAHNLDKTHAEEKQEIEPLKVGEETEIINSAMNIITDLYLHVCGVRHVYEEKKEIYQKSCHSFWRNCQLNINEKED